MFKFYTLLAVVLVVTAGLTPEQAVEKGILQIQPSALDSLRNYFEVIVLLVKQNHTDDEGDFVDVVLRMNSTQTDPSRLFGIISLEDDVQRSLEKYRFENNPSIKIMTKRTVYSFDGKAEDFEQFYENTLRPELKVVEGQHELKSNTLVFGIKDLAVDKPRFQRTSNLINERLKELGIGAVAVTENASATLSIRLDDGKVVEYVGDVDDANSVFQFALAETMPLLFRIDNSNFHTVFGSHLDVNVYAIQTQVILLYNDTIPQPELEALDATLTKVSYNNRYNELRYHRLIFGSVGMSFAGQLFGDLIEDLSGEKYRLLITRTDYSSFQLERYMYNKETLEESTLQEFIEDFRLKKLEPFYRSEKTPTEEEASRRVVKVVGKTFEEFVYKSKESVLMLFIDGKEPESYKMWQDEFEAFSDKFNEFLQGQVRTGIFDLARNEHRLLHLDFAPQIVLFEKNNKKRARSFRGDLNEDNLKEWLNYWVKGLEIPDNFGKKPLELGL